MLLPRRFRNRMLIAFVLVGTCLIIGAYYKSSEQPLNLVKVQDPVRFWTFLWAAPESCSSRSPDPLPVRLNTGEMYSKLDFSVPDNGGMGFWNDVLESRYRETRKNWKDLPLEVIVVPHAHVDPGWLRTFEDYHSAFVSDILDNAVSFLNGTRDFRFIWSEVSFFSEWWKKQNENTKATVKAILQRQQLEFVTGGWVMSDEAVTSYFANIHQLVEGHQWLQHFTGISPKHGWSVDVFGHSASYPYILSSAGISEIIIMRIHYAWKKFMALNQSLDFYWEQPFPSPRVFCHMAPSDLYSFKYACGPDPVICLKYDFRRVDKEYSESTADEIANENVEMRAEYLLSQYGRFASLFPHNVLLVPLGDDFRYNVRIEWEQQLKNYRKLFTYINNKKDLNAHVRFGTPTEYFQEVNIRMLSNASKSLLSVEGDFLPYADIYANSRPSYWTGFYTTRPFYKKLSQELEHWLRTTEILYSLAKTLVLNNFRNILIKDYSLLTSARQKLALFQHHDAVTGTSREMVMRDYGQKLHVGMLDAMSVASHVTQLLLLEHATAGTTWTSQVYPDVYRSAFDQLTRKLSISIPANGRKIIIFNSLTTERTEIVSVKIKSSLVKVVDYNLNDIPFQINPVFRSDLAISSAAFELLFVASVKPLAFTTYTIVQMSEYDQADIPKTIVSLTMNNDDFAAHGNSVFTFEKPKGENIHFDSSKVRATFSHSGLLKNIHLKEIGLSKTLEVDFFTYLPWIYRSGAYLFCPESVNVTPVRNLTHHFSSLSIVRGSLMSELSLVYHDVLKFSVRMHHFENAPAGLRLDVTSDVSKMPGDTELIMRIKSDISNEGVFYTDSNGFQMLKRKSVTELPKQGNYYPATSNVYLEDSDMRLNMLLPHSHGVTSTEGEMEILLDRRIRYDDGRGVGEGVEDSRIFSTVFWLLPEPSVTRKKGIDVSSDAFWLSSFLKYPLHIFVSEYSKTELIKRDLFFLDEPWPSDVHLVNLRTLPTDNNYSLPSEDSLMIIHQRSLSCSPKSFIDIIVNNIEKKTSFALFDVKSATVTSLTGTRIYSNTNTKSSVLTSLQACKIAFKPKIK